MPVTEVPSVLLTKVHSYLTPGNSAGLAACSQRMRDARDREVLWRQFCTHRWAGKQWVGIGGGLGPAAIAEVNAGAGTHAVIEALDELLEANEGVGGDEAAGTEAGGAVHQPMGTRPNAQAPRWKRLYYAAEVDARRTVPFRSDFVDRQWHFNFTEEAGASGMRSIRTVQFDVAEDGDGGPLSGWMHIRNYPPLPWRLEPLEVVDEAEGTGPVCQVLIASYPPHHVKRNPDDWGWIIWNDKVSMLTVRDNAQALPSILQRRSCYDQQLQYLGDEASDNHDDDSDMASNEGSVHDDHSPIIGWLTALFGLDVEVDAP